MIISLSVRIIARLAKKCKNALFGNLVTLWKLLQP
jgi:hypothetical protein